MDSSVFSEIQKGRAPFVIAEIGANHNGDLELAKKLIDSAKKTGCDAVKFQSWSKTSLFSRIIYEQNKDFKDEAFKCNSLEEMIEKLSLSPEDHKILKNYCDQKGIVFSSSCFSFSEVDMLDALEVPFFKIASMDINHLLLLEYVARKGKPILLSTGMASMEEIKTAVRRIEKTGNRQIVLLHCVALYPPKDSQIHLKNIELLKATFGYPVGFSDHSLGTSIPLAAIACGAQVIEKHFTLDHDLPGWDHKVSANPDQMTQIVKEGARVYEAIGKSERTLSEDEMKQRERFRRSIVAAGQIEKGEKITLEKLNFKRPGTGLQPDQIHQVVGRKASKVLKEDQVITVGDLD